MKVVLGIDSWYPQVDGVTNVVVSYDKQLNGAQEAMVVAPSYGAKNDAEGEEKYHSPVFHNKSVSLIFGGLRNSMPNSDKRLLARLEEFGPDVLHAHSPFAILKYFKAYGAKRNIPVIYTFHTKFKDDCLRITRSHILTAIVMRVMMKNVNRADYVWAVSKYAERALRSYGYKGEVEIVPNATDMRRLGAAEREELALTVNNKYGLKPDDIILMYAGRVVKVKNLKFSFKVLAELKRRGFKCKFFVVGDGEMKHHKRLVKKLGVEDMVVFTGGVISRGELAAYYARANLFLMPSTFDTYGLVVAEAAACGTPSLTATNSSYGEIIEDGVTGYLEELDEEKWANKIQNIFASDSYARICADCQTAAVSWEERMAQVEKIYAQIIEKHAGRDIG